MHSDNDPQMAKRVDRAARAIAAEAAEIYRAFTEPAAIVKYLSPAGARATLEAFEPQEGGAFRMKLVFEGPHVQGKTKEDTDVVEGIFEQLIQVSW